MAVMATKFVLPILSKSEKNVEIFYTFLTLRLKSPILPSTFRVVHLRVEWAEHADEISIHIFVSLSRFGRFPFRENFSRLGALAGADDAPFLEYIEEPSGAGIADLQSPLQVGSRGLAGFDHGILGFFV